MRRATLALTLFVRRAAECIAAAATALPALDAIVFTGGIGENAAGLRARIVQPARRRSAWRRSPTRRSPRTPSCRRAPARRRGSSPAVLRIVAREDLIVAREVARIVGAPQG